jgi:hypothetical protein
VPYRRVLQAVGPSRLAATSGVLREARPDESGDLVIERSDGHRIAVRLAMPHRLNVGGTLLCDSDGAPLVREGECVKLGGGFTSDGTVFVVGSVSVFDDEEPEP